MIVIAVELNAPKWKSFSKIVTCVFNLKGLGLFKLSMGFGVHAKIMSINFSIDAIEIGIDWDRLHRHRRSLREKGST